MRLDNAIPDSQSGASAPWWESLPFGFRDVRVSRGTRPAGFRFSKFIINIEASLDGMEVRACGEAKTEDLAMTKAIMELIERASLMRWHKGLNHENLGTSNGWAAHETLPQARTGAILELVERDAVLAQWYLSVPFLEITPSEWPQSILHWVRNELSQSEFPEMKLLISTEGLGPSVTCLFLNAAGYGVSGHSTKTELQDSIESAIAETCRAAHHALRRSFWNDSQILLRREERVRVQPGAHAVYYAHHEPFPAWMFGPATSWLEAEQSWNERLDLLRSEASDFKFHQALEHPVIAGFATHERAFELAWGSTDIQKVLKQAEKRNFSVSMKERTLNTQPHIVS
ncbi:MAG: YcaO-like family protein [Bacteriovoracia bacterium]